MLILVFSSSCSDGDLVSRSTIIIVLKLMNNKLTTQVVQHHDNNNNNKHIKITKIYVQLVSPALPLSNRRRRAREKSKTKNTPLVLVNKSPQNGTAKE